VKAGAGCISVYICVRTLRTMPFASAQDAENRLRTNTTKLAAEEVRDLMEWAHQLSIPAERRLTAELALQNIEAIQNFDTSSKRLTIALVVLTVALLVLTGVITFYTIVLAHRG
jgi:hypothetical protein